MTSVLFAIAAAAGTTIRWQLSERSPARPLATLAVNTVGAFALGLLANASANSQLIGGVAGLGAMTTFSTLVAELTEISASSRRLAWGYAAASLIAGVGAAWLGLKLA